MTKVGIDNEVVELKGAAETAFLAQKAADQAILDQHEADKVSKENARKNLLTKLGISEDEAKLLQ